MLAGGYITRASVEHAFNAKVEIKCQIISLLKSVSARPPVAPK